MSVLVPGSAEVEFKHFHIACGVGAGAKGMDRGTARVGALRGRMRCIGGVDVDRLAIEDFGRQTGVPGTVLDLFSREQYGAFHGHEPPASWREATAEDFRRAAHGEVPDIVFTSMPCKGFSGLLAESRSRTARYQALNGLTLRGAWLALEAWADDPPALFIFENVPRIATRGRHLLERIVALLRSYGYAVAETVHDCGVIGGLAQSRKRFLLVARHMAKLPNFVYEPPRRRLRGVGEVLDRLPLPGAAVAGPMHRVPSLQWKTWVRLAFVEAGSDWRSLNRLKVEDGVLADYGIAPDVGWQSGVLGVHPWDGTSGTVAGRNGPTNGAFSVAGPRIDGHPGSVQFRVRPYGRPATTVTGAMWPGCGPVSVADPRLELKHNNCFRVVRFDQAAGTVTGGGGPSAGGQCVADPRPAYLKDGREAYLTAGTYGVVAWDGAAGAVNATGQHDNGRWSVADPRLPAPDDRLVAVIVAEDGTWHRPFTTFELAALQSLFDPEEMFEQVDGVWARRTPEPWVLAGKSDSRWREAIGNAVPSDAGAAIGSVFCHALLLARTGQTFTLANEPIWVQPLVMALAVEQPGEGA